MTEQRRLAAIGSADVAGYSRLMGATRAARWRFLSGDERTSIVQGVVFSL